MEDKNGAFYGVVYSTFLFTLFVVFMVLKLCGVINWSWWLVTMPLWVVSALSIVLGVILLIVGLIYGAILRRKRKQYLKNVRK